MKFLGFLLGLGVVVSAFALPWWGTLLAIALAWIVGILEYALKTGGGLAYGLGAGGTFPFGLLLFLSAVNDDYAQYDLVALMGFIAMAGLLVSGRSMTARS
ncbi:hypothetical protein ACFWVU_10675 [Streptomyces sp. NPDC058686]|uniref:hypothetical protein n=1 Tax=Streptomyces sp. NPDC058686 TaxID=3346599 RepID=UPI00365FA28D